jgi:hypothetical protein
MKTQILTGSKSEIAETFARIAGVIREVIVFVEEAPELRPVGATEDIFAEMESHAASAGDADYSRHSLYTRMPGE